MTAVKEESKSVQLMVAEILNYFVEEKTSPQDILLVLREIENEAMIVLVAERLASMEVSKDE